MKCPRCGGEIENDRCINTGKSLIDIYFKLVEEKQKVRKYNDALEYLKEITKLTDDPEILEEVDRIESSINFNNYNIKTEIETDAGDSTIRGRKKQKNETLAYKSFKKLLWVSLIIFVIVGAYEFIANKYYDTLEIEDTVIDNRKLELGLLFHLNQAVNPYADVADRVSYNGLIKTLRKHPNLKFNLHISGTLIQGLLWYNPETIELIKEGLEDGQFEILGSTYSQNLLYSTDKKSNQWQVERHREIIKRVFDVEPVGFWNPERTWSQDMAEFLIQNGYKYTFVEDHIIKDSKTKYPEHILRTTADNELMIINDDYDFLEYFNRAVDAGDNESLKEDRGPNLSEEHMDYKKLFKYMRKIYSKDRNDNFVLNYAEDAEATGLWDFESQRDYNWDFKNLDFLLTKLEESKWIELKNYSELLEKKKPENLTKIVDGAATWMDKAASGKGPYSEQGYTSWFDFNKNSPKLAYYRKEHEKFVSLIEQNNKNENKAIQNLNKLAKENLLAHQFEFGCTGISGTDEDWNNGDKFGMWENQKLNLVIQEAINAIKENKEGIYIKDINSDNIKEVIAIYKDDFYVFSKARGGRLLFWYDLAEGKEITGGEIGNQLGEKYYDLNYPIQEIGYGNRTRFLNGDDELLNYLTDHKYHVRRKALNEKFIYDEEKSGFDYKVTDIFKVEMDYSMPNERTILFEADNYIKVITLMDNGLKVDYKIEDELKENLESLRVFSEFQPGYYSVVNYGRDALKVKVSENNDNSTVDIYNEISNIGVKVSTSNPVEIKTNEALMGIIADIYLDLDNSFIKIEKYKK
ncbi:MAG: hypothetical protein ACQERZ_03225 [Fusobacteriota bacterium]